MPRLPVVFMFGVVALASCAPADTITTVNRGVRVEIPVRHEGCTLRARPADPRSSPVLVTVEAGPSAGEYRIGVIGFESGVHDVAAFLQCADGTEAAGLSPIPVRVVSVLPAGIHTNLELTPPSQPYVRGIPAFVAPAVLAAWMLAPAVWFIVRWMLRRRRQVAAEVAATATQPVDRLGELIRLLGSRSLSLRERGSLELLVLRELMERRGTRSEGMSRADVLASLRADPVAGPAVEALERWLHSPNSWIPGQESGLRDLLGRVRLDAAPGHSAEPAMVEVKDAQEGGR